METRESLSLATPKLKLTTPGQIFFNPSAAHWAFALPPSKQSSNSNKGCLTGLLKDTLELSKKVMFRIPQLNKPLAT